MTGTEMFYYIALPFIILSVVLLIFFILEVRLFNQACKHFDELNSYYKQMKALRDELWGELLRIKAGDDGKCKKDTRN